RDGVVAFLTPTVAECKTKAEAIQKIGAKLSDAAAVADRILRENGYTYGARAEIRKENFPTRVYEGITLEAGEYDALILELGSGSGDNWWCVVYPPLCFAGGNQNVVYKSKIAEIIRSFYNK
ncbi:MAG: stage II sporulation protein R, partial [Clostridiales bacterium]|nr:stage II sporulation protein R [Clostridiales bacterium]